MTEKFRDRQGSQSMRGCRLPEPVDTIANAISRVRSREWLSGGYSGDANILADEVERLRLVAADESCEPKFHCFDDCFINDDHPLAWKSQYCQVCMTMCHAGNNETMTAWFETNMGAVCMLCFYDAFMAKSDKFFDTLSLTAGVESKQSEWVKR